MNKKIKRIMLVDDDINTNFFNEILLNKANACEDIVSFQNGLEALNYLKKGDNEVNLILLDINMPIMNGWMFLESYEELSDEQKAQMVIMMLTSSLNPDDKKKAEQYGIVNNFINKPINMETIQSILNLFD